MKNIASFIIVFLLMQVAAAQSKFPYDSLSRQVVYRQTFKLSSKVKPSDVYAITQKWFDNPPAFNQKNADPPSDSTKTKKWKRQLEVYDHFSNPRPAQILDPAANKVIGMGMLRYYSSSNSSVKLLFLKYDIYVEINAGIATMTVQNIHYFHYNPANFNASPLYGFGSTRPCEEVGTIESLIGCENFHTEFSSLAGYYNQEVNKLFVSFKNTLRVKKVLSEGQVASTATSNKKQGSKPTAKSTKK